MEAITKEKREGGTLPSLERVGPSWPVYPGEGRNLEMSPLLSSPITFAASSWNFTPARTLSSVSACI